MGTTLSDVIVPELFLNYTQQRTRELSAFFNSGIITTSPYFNSLANEAAPLHNMPFFEDLKGDSVNITEGTPLQPQKITSAKDVSVSIMRANSWSATGLSAVLSGADPMRAIGDLVAGYWAREYQKEIFAILEGVFKASTMTDHVADISAMSGASANISASAFIDALQLLGDAQSELTAVGMHSATKAYLKKKNLITTERDSNSVEFDTYQGRRVIVDDGCPVDNDVYTTYLFGNGALAYGEGAFPTAVATFRDDKTADGTEFLVNRKKFIMHPRGIAWQKAGIDSPTRDDLKDGNNWKRVFEPKAIRIVAFKHKIG